MSELRIGTATSEPADGTLKVGSSNVQEIYLGSSKIWPLTTPPPGEVQIGGLIWQTQNTQILEYSSGDIAFASTISQAWNYYQNQIPAYSYYRFDPNEIGRGYLYNAYAAKNITPPDGFRLPTEDDLINLWITLQSQTQEPFGRFTNIAGGVNNYWLQATTQNIYFGDSGFNAVCAGYMSINSNSGYSYSSRVENYWDQTTANNDPASTRVFALIDRDGYVEKNNVLVKYPYLSIRFCKTA